MRGADNIIQAVSMIVSQMTPVVTITANVVDSTNWKLSMCNTHWMTVGMRITIGGLTYRIESFVEDSYIIVSGASQPVVNWLQLSAPEFWHGSHRKVNAEKYGNRPDQSSPFVYLPIPEVRELNGDDDEVVYEAQIRPIFLRSYDPKKDNIDDQQTLYIDPTNKMADYFLEVIELLDAYFEYPTDITRKEWMNFGDATIWGNDKLIFNQPLSGVELRLQLDVLDRGICECEEADTVVCAPVNFSINGTAEEVLQSGSDFDLTVVDTNGDTPTISYDETTDTLTVPAPGGSASIDITINGAPFLDDQTTNVNIEVTTSTGDTEIGSEVSGQWRIGDTQVILKNSAGEAQNTSNFYSESQGNEMIADDAYSTHNGDQISSTPSGQTKTIVTRYANGTQVGTPTTDTPNSFIVEIPNPVATETYDVIVDGVNVGSLLMDGTDHNITW